MARVTSATTFPPLSGTARFVDLDGHVRAHPGTQRARRALVLFRYGGRVIALPVEAIREIDDLPGTYINAQAACLAALFIKYNLPVTQKRQTPSGPISSEKGPVL
jgi:hypothetical protein